MKARINVYVLLLVLVTLVWGTTFPALKFVTTHLSGVEVCALRFVLAAVCMLPFAWRAARHTWRDGALLGALVLVSYVSQAYGLQTISSNRSAFITSTNVLMVPFLGLLFGNRLRPVAVVAAGLACAGMALMSWEGGVHLAADIATLISALCFALYVIVLSQRSAQHDASQLAATQIMWMALLGVAWMLAASWGTDAMATLPARIDTSILVCLVYLGVVASAGMLFLQTLAQRHVTADRAALVYALEPVFAAAFAWWWLGETLGAVAAVGAVLVVMAVVWGG